MRFLKSEICFLTTSNDILKDHWKNEQISMKTENSRDANICEQKFKTDIMLNWSLFK